MGYERFHIFWFWESPTTGSLACKVKKHFHFLIICIYFYLIRSTIHFSKPLLCVTLICGDWSISFKAVFVSSVLLCVQPLPGETAIFNAPKSAPKWQRMNLHFHSDQCENQVSQVCLRNKWADNMLMFHVDFNIKRLEDSFQWFRFQILYTEHFQI